MTASEDLRALGTSPSAIEHHYDLPADFFALWLGPQLVYSCALWDEDAVDLATAQMHKIDHFARELDVQGGRVLDIGCGWGALLDRFVRRWGATGGVGLTLSPTQAEFANARGVPGVDYRRESWVDHAPLERYDAITCIEATEHLASDDATADEKVDVYRTFFDRCASWLRDGGRVGLQLICLDNVGHLGSRAGRGPLSELIRTDIFPESMPSSLSEMVLGWETHFRLETFVDHTSHYGRTFRTWGLAARARADEIQQLVGRENARVFARYFAAGEAFFRLREHALYRVILSKRPQPKQWSVVVSPSMLRDPIEPNDRLRDDHGASAAAVEAHYDISNSFYEHLLGPSMMYSSAMWAGLDDDLETAQSRKIDFFADQVLGARSAHVLDIGCGWGGNLRQLRGTDRIASGVGLTISHAQSSYLHDRPISDVEIRVESWAVHEPTRPYDALFSFGAFEHFARDGTTGPERIDAYREFFAACHAWLVDDGRIGLETIAHDDAPDTSTILGRGPLGDLVLSLYPESICPHLSELVLGFEPYFDIEVLRADAGDFARTFRQWLSALRRGQPEVLVGDETSRLWSKYLVASEMQFRMRTLNNYRVVLHRRAHIKR